MKNLISISNFSTAVMKNVQYENFKSVVVGPHSSNSFKSLRSEVPPQRRHFRQLIDLLVFYADC